MVEGLLAMALGWLFIAWMTLYFIHGELKRHHKVVEASLRSGSVEKEEEKE